jgi:hypothetical protein
MGLNNGLKCPRCGSTDTFMVGGSGLAAQAENKIPNANGLYYMCNNCKHTYPESEFAEKICEVEEFLRKGNKIDLEVPLKAYGEHESLLNVRNLKGNLIKSFMFKNEEAYRAEELYTAYLKNL